MAKALRLSMAVAAMLFAAPVMAASLNVNIVDNVHYQGTAGLYDVSPVGPNDPSPVLTNQVGTVYNVAPPAASPLPPGTPSVSNEYRSPWQYIEALGGTDYEPIGDFTSVQKDSSGDIFYGLGSNKTGLSLVWGSPDSYNSIEFLVGGSTGAVVAWIDGLSIGSAGYGGLGMNIVVLDLVGDLVFDTVRFISTGANAFEFANATAFPNNAPAVPLPAGIILLFSALAGLGFLGRARAKSA